jgi:hypothetical protein
MNASIFFVRVFQWIRIAGGFQKCTEVRYCDNRAANRATYYYNSYVKEFDLICGENIGLRLGYQNLGLIVDDFQW